MPSRKGVMRYIGQIKRSLMDCFHPCGDSSGSPPRLQISNPTNFVKLDEPFACLMELSGEDGLFMKEKYAASSATLSQHSPVSGHLSGASSPGKSAISTATFRYHAEAQDAGHLLSSRTVLVPPKIAWAA